MNQTQDRKPVINQDIQVESVSSKQASTGNMKWIITDTNKLKYFFWQKNNGEDCDVYKSFTGMGVKKGDTIHIGFTESDESFVNKEGKTVHYKDRFILGLREASGSPSRIEAVKPQAEANRGQYNESREAFNKRLGVQGHINALLSNPDYYGPEARVTITDLVKEAIAIEDEAEKQLNPSPLRQAVQRAAPNVLIPPEEELPTIQQDEDLGEDIPF